jgi:nitronate monooxygenase
MARDPLHTPLCDLLGIRVAILLAPMANGPSTPELAGAVSLAGGLGCLGVTGLTREVVGEQVRRARELAGGGPIAVNVQIGPSRPAQVGAEEVDAVLRPLREELGIAESGAGPPTPPADPPAALVEAALEAGASAVSVALGDPAEVAHLARAAGVPLIASVSSVAEARQAVASGADVIVAQGAEGGGHRTTFDVDAAPLPLVGTLVLVPRVVDAVDVPVAAAGGIMDGRGVAAALALGAQGAWVGTRFMQAEEAGTPPVQRNALATLADTDTLVTDSVTGRPARWIRNRVVETFEEAPGHLGWPGQAAAVGPIRRAAAAAGDPDLLPMLAGQGAGMVSEVKPADVIVDELAHEAREVLARLSPPLPPLS